MIIKNKLSFFLVIAVVGLIVSLTGFFKTYFIPIAANSFSWPVFIHIHGLFSFGWIILFLIQTLLIHKNSYRTHQVLGFWGLIVAVGVTVTMVPAGIYAVQRELHTGPGDSAYSSLPGVITSGFMFLILVLAGVIKRFDPETHKRLMLLATIVVLWPAWFRFRHLFPSVPRPEIWFALVFADSLIIIAWIWDRSRNGRIHPVLKYAGLFIILEQTMELILYDSPSWQQASRWMFDIVTG